jgi:acetoin utilization protein AcuC
MHEAAARLAGGSLLAATAILDGSALRAVNFGGGLHHAARDRASGFCIYNDSALAIRRLLDGGVGRVAYIDVDAHHGDGTESIFWDDPRVLTISLHESGLTLFPGTGFADEIGGRQAEGTAVNVALPSGTADAGWLRAFHAVVPQLVGAFKPEVIVSQHGCDSHRLDPLAHLNVSVDGQREAATAIAGLAARYCGNRWIATGGGGYNVMDVVPRSWSHLIAIAAGRPVPLGSRVPEDWRSYVQDKFGAAAPALMGDDVELWWRSWEVGFDPNDAVDRTVMATRKAVFPLHGLDPWFD